MVTSALKWFNGHLAWRGGHLVYNCRCCGGSTPNPAEPCACCLNPQLNVTLNLSGVGPNNAGLNGGYNLTQNPANGCNWLYNSGGISWTLGITCFIGGIAVDATLTKNTLSDHWAWSWFALIDGEGLSCNGHTLTLNGSSFFFFGDNSGLGSGIVNF